MAIEQPKKIDAEAELTEPHFFSMDRVGEIDLNQKKSVIEVLRVGKVHDRDLTITKEMLDDFVANFKAGVYGTEIQVDLKHEREGEAAGWIKDLFIDKDILKAEVEWTPLGEEKITTKQFRYISSELAPSYPDHKTGEKVKNVFIGCALTNVPAIKGLAPVSLSDNLTLYLNCNKNMADLKKIHAKLMAKESKPTADELAEYETAHKESDLPTEDKVAMKKEFKARLAEHAEPDGDEGGKKLSEKAPGVVSLTEFNAMKEQLASTSKANQELTEKIARKELSESVSDQFTLSESVKVGFKNDAETQDKVVNFLMELNEDQRETLLSEIFPLIQFADLSEIGSQGDKTTAAKLSEDAVLKKAEQLLSEGKAKDISQAQKMAMAE